MALKKILVTGAQGKGGRAIVRDLSDHGYEVVSVDLVRSVDGLPVSRVVDLTDLGQTVEIMEGCDGIVHMAAIPGDKTKTESEMFSNNTLCTYNIFQAAAIRGVKNIVWASSVTVLGLPFGNPPPMYVPVDEEHYPYTSSHYALSKVVGETMADQFSRWHGLSIQSFRIANIMEDADYEGFSALQADPHLRMVNLWSYIDSRDLAQACRKALEADLPGSRPYIIAAKDTLMNRPNSGLVAEFFPGVRIKRDLGEYDTLMRIDRARVEFGFEPEWSWQQSVER